MKTRKLVSGILIGTMLMSSVAVNSVWAEEETQDFSGVTLTLMTTTETVLDGLEAVIADAEEKFGFTIELDITGSGGDEYNNLVKTRLASGDMDDLLLYNSGALFQQLNPTQYFVDISEDEELIGKLDESYVSTVSSGDATFGIPSTSSQAGCVLYNKEAYEELGLEIPHTWDDFLENCKIAQEAGETAVITSFGDGWPGIVVNFGDYYNVHSENPNFADELTAGTAKWADTPAGVESFQKLADVAPYLNEDYMSATYNDIVDRFANGEGVHWIILTQAISNMYSLYGEEVTNNIGAFGIPGENAEDHGLTIWMPDSIYANKDSENVDAALAFMEYYVSDEALNTYTEHILPNGPYCIKGYELPENSYPAVRSDMQAYFDSGKTWPAIEFASPLEGTEIVAISQQVTMGELTAQEAAEAYDQNLEASAIQLGLDWE